MPKHHGRNEPLPRRYYRFQDVKNYLGVSERTLRAWIRHGLPCHRLGTGTLLFDLGAVDKWIGSHPNPDNLDKKAARIANDLK